MKQIKRIIHRITGVIMGSMVILASIAFLPARGQVYDTVSNWENVTPEWIVSAGSGGQVENPLSAGINTSPNCMELITSTGQYDLMFIDLDLPANFENIPFYRIKVLAPPTGGDVLLKFENANNTEWQEILLTPEPLEWVDLMFDFTGLEANDFTRMVIFVDFLGTTAGNPWYIDDVINVEMNPGVFSSYLPLVLINTEGQEIPDDPKITAQMGIIDNGPGNINTIDDAPNDFDGLIGIEIRGESSQMFPKKSYGFETRDELGENLNVPLLGMPAENDWILYAPYSDKSMLRNTFTFELARLQGAYASRTEYCEVFLNGSYIGIYVLMEKVKRDKNRVDVKELDADDNAGDSLTGGYIIRVDKIPFDFVYGTDGWLSSPNPSYPNAMDITFQYRYPDPDVMTTPQKNYIRDFVTDAEDELIGGDFDDPETGYNGYLDVGSFVDQMILNEICKEVDAYRYSTYFFKHHVKDGDKLHAGPGWDFNLGYGNVDYWAPGISTSGWVYTGVTPVPWSIMYWWKRLMEDPYFRNLLKTRWTGLRQDQFSDENLQLIVDDLVEDLGLAIDRNYERWPILGEYVWPNYFVGDTYEEELDYFTGFLFDRVEWLDANIPGTMLSPAAVISGGNQVIQLDLDDEYFNRKVLKNKYFGITDTLSGLTIDTVVYISASSAEIHLSGVVVESVEIQVNVSANVLNGFVDLTSNPLLLTALPGQEAAGNGVKVYAGRGAIHLECLFPDDLPEQMEVFCLTGQRAGIYPLEKKMNNTVSVNLEPTIYLVRITFGNRVVLKKVLLQ